MGLAEFSIHVNPDGTGTVSVDGQDVSRQVRGFTLQAEAHEVPKLVLWLNATGGVTGLADTVAVRQGEPDGEAVASFLSALDAQQLEKDVLGGMGALEGDGEVSYTAALLKRVAAIARGEW